MNVPLEHVHAAASLRRHLGPPEAVEVWSVRQLSGGTRLYVAVSPDRTDDVKPIPANWRGCEVVQTYYGKNE